MKHQIKIDKPSVGLLNIGSEANKGNELTKIAYNLLSDKLDNFIGNIESRYIFDGQANIVLCDGFTGNIVLKLIEGVTNYHLESISSKLDLTNNQKIINMKKEYDYEEYGASPILGIRGLVFKSHGSSSKIAIYNALKTAHKACSINLLNKFKNLIKEEYVS